MNQDRGGGMVKMCKHSNLKVKAKLMNQQFLSLDPCPIATQIKKHISLIIRLRNTQMYI